MDNKSLVDPGGNELLRVEGIKADQVQKRLAAEGAEVRVVDSKADGERILLIEKGTSDSLPGSIRKLQKNADLERVGPSASKVSTSDLTDKKPASGMDLPDIFDIFTRIY